MPSERRQDEHETGLGQAKRCTRGSWRDPLPADSGPELPVVRLISWLSPLRYLDWVLLSAVFRLNRDPVDLICRQTRDDPRQWRP